MKNKKVFALTAMMLLGTTALSGCFGGGGGGGLGGGTKVENSSYDATKANLSVATYDGGVGKAWLEDAIARFEAKYATATHFEAGKTGVAISLDGSKTKYSGNKLQEDGELKKDVYFTEAVDYYGLVTKGMVADISDVVTGSMSAFGESGTIEDKLDPTLKSFLTKGDGNYYMIPFYDGFYGLTYDVDLFEEAGFYFDDEGDFIGLKNFNNDRNAFKAAKANGPDGKDGTYDDGLPATYDQMIALCDEILAKGYIPFCYAGNYPDYVNRAFFSYAADYEGYNSFSLNNTFSGKAKLVKSITEKDGTMEATIEFEEVDITESNGYEVQRQAGKYYALAMQEALFGSTKYIGGKLNNIEYTVAQGDFIKSKYDAKPYAMLAEGVWWENEAEAMFALMKDSKGEGKMERRFAFMPVPKVNAAAAGDQTLFSINSSFAFINKNCANMALAKEFMRFLHTDAEMSKFSAKTSIPRSLKYEVSPADRATASYYGQSLIDMKASSKIVYPFAPANIAINNADNFEKNVWFGVSIANGTQRRDALTTFQSGNATAKQYFEGLYKYQSSVWSGLKK